MTDRVSLIRAEIKRLRKEVKDNIAELGNSESERIGLFKDLEIYDNILSFIDSMQEETKAKFKAGDKVQSESGKIAIIESVDTDKYWCVSERGMAIPFKYQDKWKLVKEPTSNDLVAEIRKYKERYGSHATFVDCAKHFAQWQKTKDESTTEDLGEYINELSKQFPEVSFAKLSRIAVRVAKWQQQQMDEYLKDMSNEIDLIGD